MALSFDTANLVIESDSSIVDLPSFHAALRDWEDNEGGVVWPVTHTYKRVDLGGGAYFHAVDLINGWQLKFPNPGNYTIIGNLNATIVPVAGVYVERQTSAAYTTTAVGADGSGGLTPEESAVFAQMALRMAELWKLAGLDPDHPMTVTPTSRTVDDISLAISGDGQSSSTVTRQ